MATTLDTYVPVIDISQYQGATDFAVMRSAAVEGVILRAGNGLRNDKMYEQYYRDARKAGYPAAAIGAYWFVNPKADADGATQGARFAARVREVTGTSRNLLMLDIEDYAGQSGSHPALTGAAFRDWITRFDDAVRAAAPQSVVIAYSNAAFWDPNVGGDPSFAAKWDWMVPRYKVYSADAYRAHPMPTDPAGWPQWAFAKATGPMPPNSQPWAGWQFSARFNQQGRRFGCSSDDLDLNIVRADRWAAWQAKLTDGAPAGSTNSGITRPQTPAAGAPAPGSAAPTTTTVRAGDSFFRVAERIYGPGDRWKTLAMNALAEANGGIDRVLHPGDELNLP